MKLFVQEDLGQLFILKRVLHVCSEWCISIIGSVEILGKPYQEDSGCPDAKEIYLFSSNKFKLN